MSSGEENANYDAIQEYLDDYCDMVDIEIVTIDEKTDINSLKKELKINSSFY